MFQTDVTTCYNVTNPAHVAQRKAAQHGQGLIELSFSLVFIVVFLYAGVELTRVWHAYTSTRHAAYQGALVAAQTQSIGQGLTALDTSVAQAGLDVASRSLTPLQQGQGYSCQLSVRFTPMFANGQRLASVGGGIRLFAPQFVITYNATSQSATF
jgi:Flp pilus assembly protein TadG